MDDRERPFEETQELLAGRHQDPRACVEALAERYGPRLIARIRAMMGEDVRRRADSVDFLHGVFVEVLDRIERVDVGSDAQLMALMTQIARNDIIDGSRKRAEESFAGASESQWSPTSSVGGTPSGLLGQAEDRARVSAALAQLPDDMQRVIRLRHFEGLRFKEIGEKLERTENAAQLLHARAMTELGLALGEA